MHMVWPGIEYSPANSSTGSFGSYSPQTPTSNFFSNGIKNENDITKIQHQTQFALAAQQFNAMNFPFVSSSYSSQNVHSASRKKPKPVPEQEKDEVYRERRSKNNDSAKRSREQRRRREEEKELKIKWLEAENTGLRHELYIIKEQLLQLRHQININNTVSPTPQQMTNNFYQ